MADYNCDYCSFSVEAGGKCDRFEYDCPFQVVQNSDFSKLNLIRKVVNDISDSVQKLKELDENWGMESEISCIESQLSDIKCKVSEDTENEWKQISEEE